MSESRDEVTGLGDPPVVRPRHHPMRVTATHTYAILDIPPQAWADIAAQLADAGYDHVFHDDGESRPVIDMHGLALRATPGEPAALPEFPQAGDIANLVNCVRRLVWELGGDVCLGGVRPTVHPLVREIEAWLNRIDNTAGPRTLVQVDGLGVDLWPVRSSNLAAAGWNGQDMAAGVLVVEFRSGARWAYEPVPQSVYGALMAAPSKGAYFAEHVRKRVAEGRYRGRPLA